MAFGSTVVSLCLLIKEMTDKTIFDRLSEIRMSRGKNNSFSAFGAIPDSVKAKILLNMMLACHWHLTSYFLSSKKFSAFELHLSSLTVFFSISGWTFWSLFDKGCKKRQQCVNHYTCQVTLLEQIGWLVQNIFLSAKQRNDFIFAD